MQATAPMYRLLQGDVGSGKTALALLAALAVIADGAERLASSRMYRLQVPLEFDNPNTLMSDGVPPTVLPGSLYGAGGAGATKLA